MDTYTRLGEPAGVGWKDVNAGRLRRWPGNLACVIPFCGDGRSYVGPDGRRRRAAPRRKRRCRRRTMRRRSPACSERRSGCAWRAILKVQCDLCWGSEMGSALLKIAVRLSGPIMCDVLSVSRAGYYAWRPRPESARAAANRELVDDIRRAHRDTNGRHGSPCI